MIVRERSYKIGMLVEELQVIKKLRSMLHREEDYEIIQNELLIKRLEKLREKMKKINEERE